MTIQRNLLMFFLFISLLIVSSCGDKPFEPRFAGNAEPRETSQWPEYGGGQGQRYAAAGEITPQNVRDLKVAWIYRTGDIAEPGKGPFKTGSAFENTPLLMDGKMFICSPFNRVVALDPVSGAEIWNFDPEIDKSANYSNQFVCRGVAYHAREAESGALCDRTIFTATNDTQLIALDAETGAPCPGFGDAGRVALAKGVGETRWKGEYQHTSPPLVIGDLVIVGGSLGDNARRQPPSGVVRAYDAQSGALKWAFDLAPPDYDGPASDAGYALGTPNVWAPMVADLERGLVFIPTGNPSPDYYRETGNRLDYYGSSVVALEAATGKSVWHYQTVHHDLWDFDIPAQPTLLDLERDGVRIPALVQATKMGFLFVLNRETGAPVFPVEERPVPQVDVPGLQVSPTQPFPQEWLQLSATDLKPEEAWGITFWDEGKCRQAIKDLRFDGMYTVANEKWTLMYPGNAGGSNWGGVAVDPEDEIVIANVMNLPWRVRLIPREEMPSRGSYDGHGELMQMEGYPYGGQRELVMSPFGIPCAPPPWGKLVAVNLKTGEKLWDVPLGTIRDVAPVPLNWKLGVPNLGGPLVTAGGLVFIGAAADNYLRAFDLKTGKEVWKGRLPAGGQATPMSYVVTGPNGREKQYVVIAAGGHQRAGTKLGDYIIAYALP
ncbi:MAG: pyrroloquinoline quinone-dependent dehydrogenase [Alphaproteobacteria bacterium]|nr:MAG: pyrroloquinoline quinone-dependent dehydrogenase [Alphaproteobacteria bacterium]